MSDIVERLNRAGDLAIPGEPCGIYYDAANEIERLRSLVRFQDKVIRSGDVACLTQAERQAIKEAADAYEQNNGDPDCERIADTLHGLLDRLGGT